MKRQKAKWLMGMVMVAVAVCAIAITSRGGDGDAMATARTHPSLYAGVQPDQRPQQELYIAANQAAADGMKGARLLPTPLDAEPKGKEVLVSVGVGSCGSKRPALKTITVVEGRKRLILTAYVLYPAKQKSRPCAEAEHVLLQRVQLKAPNGNRPIYDGVRRPPRQVWP
jgi:hypothetical protein